MKKNHSTVTGYLTAIAMLASASAFAASDSQSVATSKSLKDSLLLTYWGEVTGPGIKDPSRTNPDGDTLNLYSSPRLGYKFNADQAAFFNPRLNTQLVGGNGTQLGQTRWKNPRIGFKDNAMYTSQSGNTTLYGEIHAELPLGDGSNNSLAIAPGFSNFLNHTFQGSRWSYGQWSTLRAYFYGRRPNEPQTILGIEFYPEMDYQLSENVNFRFLARFEYYPSGSASFALADEIDRGSAGGVLMLLQPGVVWNVTKKLSFNPYIQLRPKQAFNINSTSIGMEISGTVF